MCLSASVRCLLPEDTGDGRALPQAGVLPSTTPGFLWTLFEAPGRGQDQQFGRRFPGTRFRNEGSRCHTEDLPSGQVSAEGDPLVPSL